MKLMALRKLIPDVAIAAELKRASLFELSIYPHTIRIVLPKNMHNETAAQVIRAALDEYAGCRAAPE